jgi:hypothetical protein
VADDAEVGVAPELLEEGGEAEDGEEVLLF